MNINRYKMLISNLPVREQSHTTVRATWEKSEKKIKWLKTINNKLFNGSTHLTVSRNDIFKARIFREKILKIIYWGYPRGMRGNHFTNILININSLERALKFLKKKKSPNNEDFKKLTDELKKIPGLGLSTYSKVLYFFNISFNKNPSLILDQRLLDIFVTDSYDCFQSLGNIKYHNKERMYMDYLDIMKKASRDIGTKGENIEQFLFIFGNNLKC